ncbi:MAG TPA: hypothetical protein PKB02_04090 [Anaerohalosphaeraceae bacterium]|nr:hypothetical protein [Anaerohalosphaeraceae bacterium]
MGKTVRCLMLVIAGTGLFISGCAKEAQVQTISKTQIPLAVKTGQSAQFESTSQLIKDFKFEQPTLNKSREEQTSTVVTVTYDQKIAEIQSDGSAVADITLKAVQCKMVNKNEVRYEFNSADEKNKGDALNSIIGKGYRIAISPEGKVTVVDAAAARAVVVSGEGQKIAQKIFMDESIIERHSLPLPKTDISKTTVQLNYEEKKVDISPENTVVYDIFIKSLSCQRIENNNVLYSFDSADSKSSKDPLFGVIGKSYRIAEEKNGEIKVVDAGSVRLKVTDKEAQRAVDDIFDNFAIIDRHKNAGSRDIATTIPYWTMVQPSPPGLLAPKTFEKVYLASEAGKDKVVVTMTARENLDKPAENQAAGASSMGIFAKMFDNQDEFTGTLVMNPADGTVSEYNETLVSSYVAQEKPQNAPADAAPDTLLMQLTYSISLKKIN